MTRRIPLLALSLTAIAMVAAGCGGASDTKDSTGSGGGGSTKLALVSYSTPQVVYDELIPKFQQTAAGKGISFSESFGASGEQSRAVEAGLPADIVAFSLAPDVNRLVKAGLVGADWAGNDKHGFVSKSVVAFTVRKGNPKGIHGWDDLLKPGVQVLTPNPFTSGGAKWNLMAAYGATSAAGKNPAAGLAYLSKLIKSHVKVQDKSARDALNSFTQGAGDVLISYENEAITAQQKGKKVDYVVPDDTILIENPIAVLSKSKHAAAARAFVDYAWSSVGQTVFAEHGYRPVDTAVLARFASKFPTPKGLFTIDDLGGWSKVNDSFFDPDKGSIAKIERDAGVSTSK